MKSEIALVAEACQHSGCVWFSSLFSVPLLRGFAQGSALYHIVSFLQSCSAAM